MCAREQVMQVNKASLVHQHSPAVMLILHGIVLTFHPCSLHPQPPSFCTCTYATLQPQLFADSVPSVPLSSSAPQLHPPHPQPLQHNQHQQQHTVNLTAAPPTALEGGFWQENTLDESVWQTLKRDVLTIGRNLRSVLIPVNWDFNNHTAALHNWDLWGPLVGFAASGLMIGLAAVCWVCVQSKRCLLWLGRATAAAGLAGCW